MSPEWAGESPEWEKGSWASSVTVLGGGRFMVMALGC